MGQLEEELKVLAEGRHLRLVSRGRWEYVERPKVTGIVIIVAVTRENNVVLVEQNRPPVGGRVIELPAGLAGDIAGSESEAMEEAARRELLEETGVVAYSPRLRFLESNTARNGIYVAYWAPSVVFFPNILRSVPFEGFVGWHHPQELLSPKVTHHNFYRRLFTKIGL